MESFDVSPMDYLVKPLKPEKVSRCLERLREYLSRPASISLPETSGRGHSAPVDVAFEDILYAQCFAHAIDVHTTSGVYHTRMPFREFTAQLPHTGRFCVCGRGLAINLSQVTQVKGNALLLKNGERITVPRTRSREVQQAYAEWLFTCSRKGGWA